MVQVKGGVSAALWKSNRHKTNRVCKRTKIKIARITDLTIPILRRFLTPLLCVEILRHDSAQTNVAKLPVPASLRAVRNCCDQVIKLYSDLQICPYPF